MKGVHARKTKPTTTIQCTQTKLSKLYDRHIGQALVRVMVQSEITQTHHIVNRQGDIGNMSKVLHRVLETGGRQKGSHKDCKWCKPNGVSRSYAVCCQQDLKFMQEGDDARSGSMCGSGG